MPALSRPLLWALATYFVVIWGAGYVATRAALQYAAPFTYIGIRFAIGAVVAGAFALAVKAAWPKDARTWGHVAVAGLLVNVGYLGASHYAQFWGMSAGLVALILALQPIITSVLAARLLHERLTRLQMVGVWVGLLGVALVVAHKIDIRAVTPSALAVVGVALVLITGGTLYQRRYCPDTDLRSSIAIHFAASAAVGLPLGWALEGFAIQWVPTIGWTLLYHVLLASMGAATILHFLMRRGQATQVTSLLYLTPPVAVITEWAMFGVLPTGLALLGMVVACVGVAMTSRRTASGIN